MRAITKLRLASALALGLLAAMPLHAATYYAKAGSKDGLFPTTNCVWYVDEGCTTKTSISGLSAGQVKPASNDGNTYVILSTARFSAPYVAPDDTRFEFRLAEDDKCIFKASGTAGWASTTVSNFTAMVTAAVVVQWEGEYTFLEDGTWMFTTDGGTQ